MKDITFLVMMFVKDRGMVPHSPFFRRKKELNLLRNML